MMTATQNLMGLDEPQLAGSSKPLVLGLISTASAIVSGYHGFKRNDSYGWGIAWFILGGTFPILTPLAAIAMSPGYAKRKPR